MEHQHKPTTHQTHDDAGTITTKRCPCGYVQSVTFTYLDGSKVTY